MKVEGFLYSVFLICIHCQQAFFFFFLLTILVLIELKNGGAACLLSKIFMLLQGLADRNVKFCTRTTLSDNAITNSIDIHRSTR